MPNPEDNPTEESPEDNPTEENLEDDLIEESPENNPTGERQDVFFEIDLGEDSMQEMGAPPAGSGLSQRMRRRLQARHMQHSSPPWCLVGVVVAALLAATGLLLAVLVDEIQGVSKNSTGSAGTTYTGVLSPCNHHPVHTPTQCGTAATVMGLCLYAVLAMFIYRLMQFVYFPCPVRRQVEGADTQVLMEVEEVPPTGGDPPPVDPEEQPEGGIDNPTVGSQEEDRGK